MSKKNQILHHCRLLNYSTCSHSIKEILFSDFLFNTVNKFPKIKFIFHKSNFIPEIKKHIENKKEADQDFRSPLHLTATSV